MKSVVGKHLQTEKVVMLGAASTGKTSIVNRFAHQHFSASSESTIGAAFVSKIIKIQDQEVKLEIWDTGGSERYRSLAPMYYRDTQTAIIVFDLTSAASLDAAQMWFEELHQNGPSKVVVGCAANKADITDKREVSEIEFKDFVERNKIEIYKETSALSGSNINELFYELAESVLKANNPRIEPTVVDVTNTQNEKGCC